MSDKTALNEPAPVVTHAHSKVRMNIWVKKHLYDAAMDIAKEEDWTQSDVVREALKYFIRKQKSSRRR